jgi:diguanylate cyclase (GGDEF)-like protein
MLRGCAHPDHGVDRVRVSLSAKILLLVFVAVAVTSTLAGVVSYRSERREILDSVSYDALELSEMVDAVLRAAMVSHDATGVKELLAGLRASDDVSAITIYNSNGNPVFGDPGPSLSAEGHAALAAGRTIGTPVGSGEGSVYRSFRPIALESGCFVAACHGPNDPIAGAVQVDLRTDDLAQRLNRESTQAIYLGLGLALVLVPLLWLVLAVTVVHPLRMFATRARSIASGRLWERVPKYHKDEIGDLAESFNSMADELESRIAELETAQDKLGLSIERVAGALTSALDAGSVLHVLINESTELAGFDAGAVFLERGGEFVYAHGRHFEEESRQLGLWDATLQEAGQRLLALGPLLGASAMPRVTYAQHAGDDGGSSALPWGWETVVLTPMVAEGCLIGCLVLVSTQHLALNQNQRRALELLAAQGAIAVVHSRLNDQAHERAVTDGLTGLSDHRHFYEQLELEMVRAERYDLPLSLLLLDIDHFKLYNDREGHRAGDQVLRRLGGILRAVARETDVVARYGGEEFAIILPHTGAEDALAFAERVHGEVESELFPRGELQPSGHVSVSVGVASWPDHARTVEGLVESADQALYRAKREGRDRVVGCGHTAGGADEPVRPALR